MKSILFSTSMVQALLNGRKSQTRRVIKDLPDCRFDSLDTDPEVCFDGDLEKTATLSGLWATFEAYGDYFTDFPMRKSKYQIGDILWVRETWGKNLENSCKGIKTGECKQPYCGAADEPCFDEYYVYKADECADRCTIWKHSIHMPREAARIFLRVTNVKVERVQDITEADAKAEGVPNDLDYPIEKTYCPRCQGVGLTGSFHSGTLGYMEIDCPDCDTTVKRFRNLWDSLNAKRGYSWESNPWVWVYEFERISNPKTTAYAD